MNFTINSDFETKNDLEKYIGKTFTSCSDGEYCVLGVNERQSYKDGGRIVYLIRFVDTGYLTYISRTKMQTGEVRDYLKPSVCGIGCMGYIEIDTELKKTLYSVWYSMIRRCYDENDEAFIKFYSDCSVDERWHNFSNFYNDALEIPNAEFKIATELYKSKLKENQNYKIKIEDFDLKLKVENIDSFIKEISSFSWELDKDILKHGNKIYSRDTCSWTPSQLNSFFTNKNSKNTSGFEGCSFESESNGKTTYQSLIRWDGKLIKIGKFDSLLEGYNAYHKKKTELLEFYLEEKFSYVDKVVKKAMRKKLKLQYQETLESNGITSNSSKSNNKELCIIEPDLDKVNEIIERRKIDSILELESGDTNRLKLNPDKAKEIKILLQYSDLKQDEIGALYNVTRNNISYIANGRRWSEVTIS